MSRIKSTMSAVRMLGVFGFILVLAVIIITQSIYNIFLLDRGIVAIHEHSERRFVLENIEYYLLDAELAERLFILHEGDPAMVEQFNAADEQLDVYLERLRALDTSLRAPEAQSEASDTAAMADNVEIALLEDFRAEVEADFREIVAEWEDGHHEDPAVLDAIFREEEGIDQTLDDLVFESETLLGRDLRALKEVNRRAALLGIGGLIAFPLLAVWAFLVASRLTQPILRLTNAVVAIGGGHYREELLDEVVNQRSGLGGLAIVVDRMADALREREAELALDVEHLQAQLHDARRRKLVLTAAVRSRE